MTEDTSLTELRRLLTDEERYNLQMLLRFNGHLGSTNVYFKHLPD